MGNRRSTMLAGCSLLAASAGLRWVRLAQRCRTWSSFTVPNQHLWRGIGNGYEQTDGPHGGCTLTFSNERAALGTASVMADVAARFEPRQDDVHIVTYPKAGTSWIQELTWLVNHNADLSAARATPSGQRTTYIELAIPNVDKLARLGAAPSPRHVKWHHAAWLLPPAVVSENKIIYLYRNPKDLVVSWYHFQRLNPIYGFEGSFGQFFDHFLEGHVA